MKEHYYELDLKIVEFDTEDIITESDPVINDPNTPGGKEPWA